jgi:selenocysteine lyase/cysteine desulfurase
MEAVVAYLERLGHRIGGAPGNAAAPRRESIRVAMDAIAVYEAMLSAALLEAVLSIDGAVVHGITDCRHLEDRVPTVSFSVGDIPPSAIAGELAARDVGARSGHMYAPRLMQRLNLMPGGVVRVSLVHYNTLDEVARFRDALAEVVTGLRAAAQGPKPTPRRDGGVPIADRR